MTDADSPPPDVAPPTPPPPPPPDVAPPTPPPPPPSAGPPPPPPGADPTPYGPNSSTPEKRHWAAKTALIVGIVALVVALIPILGFVGMVVLAPAGIVFAIIGILKTGAGKARGRKMAVWGLILSIVSVLAAVTWLILYNIALDNSLDSLYGNDRITTGPGRTEASALPFGTPSVDENGTRQIATPPVTVDMPDDLHDFGYNLAFSTTINFRNEGDQDVYYQPWGRSSVVPAGECKSIGKNLSVTENPRLILKPGESKSVDAVFACKSTDPAGVVNVMLESAAYSSSSTSFFTGPLDGGETR